MPSKLTDSELNRLRTVVNVGTKDLPEEKIRNAKTAVPKAPLKPKFVQKKASSMDPDAQLFVKVEEHESVGNDLHKAREDIKTIATTIELLAKAEKLKAEAIDRMEQHVANFDKLLAKIESRVIPPDDILAQGMEEHAVVATTSAMAEVSDLTESLKSLKEKLSKMK